MATYVLCTDTGTIFEKKCVKSLVKYMERNPEVSGATGTQVVMTPEMQAAPGDKPEGCFSFENFLRSVQGYEYDITHAIDKSAFSAAGFMPVLPGPCGLFRMSDIRGLACENYFDFVHQTPEQLGLIGSNLCLAEDRILTLESVCSSGNGSSCSFSRWVPQAIFYFEAETELEMFVKQRRRWSNGTFAGWLWLVSNPSKLWNTQHSFLFKTLSTVLILTELLKSFMLLFAPCMWAISLNFSVQAFVQHPPAPYEYAWFYLPQHTAVVGYGLLYCCFCTYHISHAYSHVLWNLVVFVNAGVIVLLMASCVVSVSRATGTAETNRILSTLGGFSIIFIFPLFIKIITVDVKSFLRIFRNCIQYTLFLPTIFGKCALSLKCSVW
jgi:cellulose synthase/poly-beta-1,6-N-acetylglucosamine synthase-like glycosyltransferase